MILVAVLCALLVVSLAVATWAVLAGEKPPGTGHRCDICDKPATIRLVSTFDDDTEQDIGAQGGSVMVADYCPVHTPAA
jgi:hypothetical protein